MYIYKFHELYFKMTKENLVMLTTEWFEAYVWN